MLLFGACPNEPALKWFCSRSSRDAPAWDLALKIRCTLKNGEPAERCSKQRCPSTVHCPPRREREPAETEIVVKNHEMTRSENGD